MSGRLLSFPRPSITLHSPLNEAPKAASGSEGGTSERPTSRRKATSEGGEWGGEGRSLSRSSCRLASFTYSPRPGLRPEWMKGEGRDDKAVNGWDWMTRPHTFSPPHVTHSWSVPLLITFTPWAEPKVRGAERNGMRCGAAHFVHLTSLPLPIPFTLAALNLHLTKGIVHEGFNHPWWPEGTEWWTERATERTKGMVRIRLNIYTIPLLLGYILLSGKIHRY